MSTVDLEDARDSLAYWEDRAERLPARAVRKRREARDMAARWQARVTEAERAAYGRGLLGALLLVLAEQRLPQPARQSARHVARRAKQAVLLVTLTFAAVIVLGLAAVAELLGALL